MESKRKLFKKQLPLEAMLSDEHISIEEIKPRELIKRLASQSGMLIKLIGSEDEGIQDFLSSVSMDTVIDIAHKNNDNEMAVYCDSVKIGRVDDARAEKSLKSKDNLAFIQKVELDESGYYAVTIAVVEKPE